MARTLNILHLNPNEHGLLPEALRGRLGLFRIVSGVNSLENVHRLSLWDMLASGELTSNANTTPESDELFLYLDSMATSVRLLTNQAVFPLSYFARAKLPGMKMGWHQDKSLYLVRCMTRSCIEISHLYIKRKGIKMPGDPDAWAIVIPPGWSLWMDPVAGGKHPSPLDGSFFEHQAEAGKVAEVSVF